MAIFESMEWWANVSQILLNLCLIFGILWGLFRLTERSPLAPLFPYAATLKLLAGIGVGLVYRYFYGGGDTFVMFGDGVYLADLARNDPFEYLRFFLFNDREQDVSIYSHLGADNSRAVLISKICSLFNLLTGGNYWLTCCYFSILSFVGIWLCANQLALLFPSYKAVASFCFFLLPSFVFWTSGIMKEGVLWLAQGYIMTFFLFWVRGLAYKKAAFEQRWIQIVSVLLLLLALYLAWKIKYYDLAVLLPSMLAAFFILKYFPKSLGGWQTTLSFLGIYVLIALTASLLHPNLNIDSILEVLVKNYREMAAATENRQNLIQYRNLAPSWESILQNMPKALWQGFFRPYLWEAGHIFKKLIAIEQTLLFAAIVGWIAQNCPTPFSRRNKILVLACTTFVLVLATMLAIAAPNVGNLIRYKTAFLPFLWFMLLAGNRLTDERLAHWFGFGKK